MDLEPEQVPDAVRKEHAGESGRHGLVGGAVDDAGLAQQAADQPVREQVHFAVVGAAADRVAKPQLQ